MNHEFPLIKTQKSVSSSTVKKIRLQYIDQVLQVFQTTIGVDSDSHRKGILADSDSHRKVILVDWQVVVKGSRQERRERRRI